ncbi:hypothetical protein [Microbacterium sp. CIAB417]|uniref:hypothetical protein n=1 Tax=Microbacterium sp. CIAB417 TaxID=2860287 RepID=UPI001FAD5331|nr:hypothetical protein [Microbacterium sp. CIAB417]
MTLEQDSVVVVTRTGERRSDPIDYRHVRRAMDSGRVVRIARGSYALTEPWGALRPIERHRQRVHEAMSRLQGQVVFSHFAAAAIHDIDVLGQWPQSVDVRVARANGGRSTGLIRRRSMGTDEAETEQWNEHFVTSAAQTAMDLAAVLPFTLGVVVIDQVLWWRREGGALATKDELHAILENGSIRRGLVKAQRTLEFGTHLSDSVRESHSRVLIHRLGFPPPLLQHPIRLLDGTLVHPDFYWEHEDHAGEFDGVGKYLDPALLAGRNAEQALIAEKDRADALRRVVSGASRWRTPALRRPRELYDILTADGMRSARPRPSAGFRPW